MLALTSWGCPPSTSGWPAGTAAVPQNHSLPPTPAYSSSSPPLSLSPGTSCCLQHLGKVGANGCPCSGIPSTLHPVRRGGNLGTGIRPAVQPRGPRLASCSLPEPGMPGRSPRVPLGSLWGPCASLTAPILSPSAARHICGIGLGPEVRALPHILLYPPFFWAAKAGIALSSRGIPGCPRAQAHAACQLLALL